MSHWTSTSVSEKYLSFRPTYPPELYDAVLKHVYGSRAEDAGGSTDTRQEHGGDVSGTTMLDVGCGTGQALLPFVPHFETVFGNDISETQVAAAASYVHSNESGIKKKHQSRIHVMVGSASKFTLSAEVPMVDLVTVAQAMHWFDMPAFAHQLEAHLRPGGHLAVWLYERNKLLPQPCDDLLAQFDRKLMEEKHWPAERRHIDNAYVDLVPQIPFPLVETVAMDKTEEQPLPRFFDYLSTWSGVNRYIAQTGHETVLDELQQSMHKELERAGLSKLMVCIPIRLFVFRRPPLLP